MKMPPERLTLRIITEGSAIVVRSLEYDIAAHSDSLEDAVLAWAQVFAGQIQLDRKAGREPLEGIPPWHGGYECGTCGTMPEFDMDRVLEFLGKKQS